MLRTSLEDFRREIDERLAELASDDEPPIFSFNFLILECPEKDLGRATAVRNFWAWICYGDVYGKDA